MAFCSYCGTEGDGAFCGACGKPMAQPVEEVVVPVEEIVPPVEEIVSPVEEIVPPVEEIVPPVEEIVPPVEEIVPPVEEVVPPVEEVVPPVEENVVPAVSEVPAAPIGYDPQTGAPIYAEAPAQEVPVAQPTVIGYDPQTGEPIYAAPAVEPTIVGYDPQTGEPIYAAPAVEPTIVGYDPQTGAPIYAEVPAVEAVQPSKGAAAFGTVALILSIVAVCLGWIPFFIGMAFVIPAAVFTVLAWVKKAKKGKTIASTVMTGVALLAALIVGIASVAALDTADDYYDDDYDYDYGYDYDDYDYDYDYSYSSPNFSSLYNTYCDSDYAVYDASENYLYIATSINGYYDSDAWEAIKDVNSALGLPYSLNNDMLTTTVDDGEQSKSYDDVFVWWKYTSKNGLEVIYMEN